MASEASAQLVLRVDKDQTVNTPDGFDWSTAYPNLQGALTEARTRWSDSDPTNNVSEIWVAEGVYKPTASTTDRAATFRLVPGVEVYGGFLGNELSRAARAGSFNLTILSGDIDGDPRNQLADSLHVVTVDEAGSFRLDGFQVMFGAAVPTVPTPPGQVSDIDAADELVFETIPIPGGSGAFQWNRGLGDPLDIDGDGITAEFLPLDLDDLTRELDMVNLPDTGRDYAQFARIGDMGCYEQFLNEAPL